jgi:CRP/FNR family transcriptional regulator, cyclic AMP receptor protein
MRGSSDTKRRRRANVNPSVGSLLENIVAGKDLLKLRKGAKLFSQGEKADAIYFIETGKIQLNVVSVHGKVALLGTRGPRDFLGEECLVKASRRTSTAISMGPARVYGIRKEAMIEALVGQPRLAENFTASLLARNVNLEEHICDQLFNHTEMRLARLLLTLSRFGPHDNLPDTTVPKFTHEMLAKMVGTSRPRITFFMTKFRKLGLVQYEKGNTDIVIMAEALTDSILRDEFKAAGATGPTKRGKLKT